MHLQLCANDFLREGNLLQRDLIAAAGLELCRKRCGVCEGDLERDFGTLPGFVDQLVSNCTIALHLSYHRLR